MSVPHSGEASPASKSSKVAKFLSKPAKLTADLIARGDKPQSIPQPNPLLDPNPATPSTSQPSPDSHPNTSPSSSPPQPAIPATSSLTSPSLMTRSKSSTSTESASSDSPTSGNMANHYQIFEYLQATRFTGTDGIPINDFISEIESAASSSYDVSDDHFATECLRIAKTRLELQNYSVSNAFKSFKSLASNLQTWEAFKKIFRMTFHVHKLNAARMHRKLFTLQPEDFSPREIANFLNVLCDELQAWHTQALVEGLPTVSTAATLPTDQVDYHIHLILMGLVPVDQQDKLFDKLRKTDRHDIPQLFSRFTDVRVPNAMAPTVISAEKRSCFAGQATAETSANRQDSQGYGNSFQSNRGGFANVRGQPRGRGRGRGYGRGAGQHNSFANHNSFGSASRQTYNSFSQGNHQQSWPRMSNVNANDRNDIAKPNETWVPTDDQCWVCLGRGHYGRDCYNSPRCPYHGRPVQGHSWDYCQVHSNRADRTLQALKAQRKARQNTRGNQVFHVITEELEPPPTAIEGEPRLPEGTAAAQENYFS